MKSYIETNVGKVRENNEDYVYARDDAPGPVSNIYLLADGMGGHAGGELASRYVIDHIAAYVEEAGLEDPEDALRESILRAGASMRREYFHTSYSGMGTTLVAATVKDGMLFVANIGDSRLYVHTPGRGLVQITTDHSWVEEMVSAGRLERGCDVYRENKSIITRAVTPKLDAVPDFFKVGLGKGDIILMCSDGLSNMLTDDTMSEILSAGGTLKEQGRALVDAALEAGGIDNMSVILIDPEIDEVTVC